MYLTLILANRTAYLEGGADPGPPWPPMGSKQLFQHRVGGGNLDAPFLPGGGDC